MCDVWANYLQLLGWQIIEFFVREMAGYDY